MKRISLILPTAAPPAFFRLLAVLSLFLMGNGKADILLDNLDDNTNGGVFVFLGEYVDPESQEFFCSGAGGGGDAIYEVSFTVLEAVDFRFTGSIIPDGAVRNCRGEVEEKGFVMILIDKV